MKGKELEKEKLAKPFTDKKIGLALSGGRYRIVVFHLGMLSYIAENDLLERVKHISTVSGGSIVMGLICKFNNFKWLTSKEYLENIHEEKISFHLVVQSSMFHYAKINNFGKGLGMIRLETMRCFFMFR